MKLPLIAKGFYGVVTAALAAVLVAFFAVDVNGLILTRLNSRTQPTPFQIYVPKQIYASERARAADAVFVGGSSLRELLPNGPELDNLLTSACNKQLTAFNGSTTSQSLTDSLAVLDAIGRMGRPPRLIVVGLTYFRLTPDWKDTPALLASQHVALPAPQLLVTDLSPLERLAWRITDRFYQLRRLSPLLTSFTIVAGSNDAAPIESQHFYDYPPTAPHAKRLEALLMSELRHSDYHTNTLRNARLFAAYFAEYRRNGAKIVFLFTPFAPSTWAATSPMNETIEAAKAILAATGDVLDFRQEPSLAETMFYDMQHLRPQGRASLWADPAASPLLRALCAHL